MATQDGDSGQPDAADRTAADRAATDRTATGRQDGPELDFAGVVFAAELEDIAASRKRRYEYHAGLAPEAYGTADDPCAAPDAESAAPQVAGDLRGFRLAVERLDGFVAADGREERLRRFLGGKGVDVKIAPELVGLAHSGGGIRSSTFCLGALQALARNASLRYVDYLSTVSGGGYVGSCWSAMAQRSDPKYLEPEPREAGRIPDDDQRLFPFVHSEGRVERYPLLWLRDRARYLAPRGLLDMLRGPALLARGLLLNLISISKYVLALAIVTVWILSCSFLVNDRPFDITLWLLVVFAVLMVLYTMVQTLFRGQPGLKQFARSYVIGNRSTWSLRDWALRAGGIGTALVIVTAICEAQPLAIETLNDWRKDPESFATRFGTFRTETWPLITAVVAAATGLLAKFTGRSKSHWMSKLFAFLASLLVPLTIWLVYLVLSCWGLYGTSPGLPDTLPGPTVMIRYYLVFLGLLVLTLFLNPNVFSLHNFYRDALSRTFLFAMRDGDDGKGATPTHQDDLRISDLEVKRSGAPYHLINATVNNSDLGDALLRGRRSDVFFFSPRWTGNDRLGYCTTDRLEKHNRHVNLGTAMAISAAAASVSMGEKTTSPLVRFALAVLNVRLNYWLPTPKRVMRKPGLLPWKLTSAPPLYFFGELGILPRSRRLSSVPMRPTSPAGYIEHFLDQFLGHFINVSDGGHIENLGVYELLRRRCRYIIAIDAEADPKMTFNGLATLVKLARIDMGIRIDINVDALRPDAQGRSRRHWALGHIGYSKNQYGELLYIKSSVTGGENAYINEYRARHPSFPHQSTADQFFDETQFECYRALGYQCASSLFRDLQREEVDDDKLGMTTRLADLFTDLRRRLDAEGFDDETFAQLQRQRASIERRLADTPAFAAYARELSELPTDGGPARRNGESDADGDEGGSAPGEDVPVKLTQIVNEQLQLMERVVIGLELVKGSNQLKARNRGWMNLFRRWAESPTFQVIWAFSVSDYSTSFQRFCDEALGLDLSLTWRPYADQGVTDVEESFQQQVGNRLPAGSEPKIWIACVAPKQSSHRAQAEIPPIRVALAILFETPGEPPCLIGFRIRDTFRGMRLTEPLLSKLHGELLPPGALDRKDLTVGMPTFWFGDHEPEEAKAVERTLLRLDYERLSKDKRPTA